MKIDFSGKTAVITGAARGIGKSVALLFAELGADVWIGDLNEENAKQTASEIKAMGRKGGYEVIDVSKYEDMQRLLDTAEKQIGKIDLMLNIAGMVLHDSFLEATPEKIKKIMDINILSVAYGSKLALEKMIPRKYGKIINFSSTAGRGGQFTIPYYSMTKAAVINLTQDAAHAGASAGINVNTICPGIVRTAMWESILDVRAPDPNETQEEREKRWESSVNSYIPMRKPQEPIDLAWACAFLCSDYARYITGQALNVCGGIKMN